MDGPGGRQRLPSSFRYWRLDIIQHIEPGASLGSLPVFNANATPMGLRYSSAQPIRAGA